MKEDKRQKELNEFNQTLQEQPAQPKSLAEEFKQLDANKQLPQTNNPELDRRRMIYKNIRKEISEADKAEKEKAYAQKMLALEQKVKQKEEEKRQKQAVDAQQAAEADRIKK